MNKTMLAVSTANPLIRKWHRTGPPGTLLICNWTRPEGAQAHSDSTTTEIGDQLKCA